MTSRWKLRQNLRKQYEEYIESVESNLQIQRSMAIKFIDANDFKAVCAVHLIMIQDEEEIERVRNKLNLLNDDSCFEQVCNEQDEAGE